MKYTVFHLDDGKELRGGEHQVLRLVKELNKLGHNNYIVCRNNSMLFNEAKKRNFQTICVPYFFEWDPVSAIILRRAADKLKNGTTVFHAHTGHTPSLAIQASLGADYLKISHRRVNFKVSKASMRSKYSKCDGIICVANAIKDTMIQAGSDEKKTFVVKSSIDTDELPWINSDFDSYRNLARKELLAQTGFPENAFIICALIALDIAKDPENLVRAAEIVTKKCSNAYYVLAGDGKLKEKIQRMLEDKGLTGRFKLLGYRKDSYKILAASDLYTLSSREEGIASGQIEALAANLPIVATNAGGIGDVTKDGVNGLLVPIENSEALAEAQIKLISNADMRKNMIIAGNKILREQFTSSRMAEETLKCYAKAIERLKQ